MKHIRYIITIMLFGVLTAFADQQVIQITDQSTGLNQRWQQAFQKAKDMEDSYWIGYSITINSEKTFNTWNHHAGRHQILHEIIHGTDDQQNRSIQDAAQAALNGNYPQSGKWCNQYGLLFCFKEEGDRIYEAYEINILNMQSWVDLRGYPLIWMGHTSQEESVSLLLDVYPKIKLQDQKEKMISAIGMHQQQPEAAAFLKKTIKSDEKSGLRGKAVFWLSQQDTEVLEFLVNVAHHDRSRDVREQAVFAVSLLDNKDAEEALITLARKNTDREVRKKAIFWLGQKASEKSNGIIKGCGK